MKINEVEQMLGISKANIRFYEKQNLLSPHRKENGYREYSQEDVARLQTVIVLRKLGICVQDIEHILNGGLDFQDAIQKNISELEQQIDELRSSLELSRQIASEKSDSLDTQRYWRIIQEKESQGAEFVDIVSDYWLTVLQPMVFRKFALDENMSLLKKVLTVAVICAIYSVVKTFIWKDGNLLINFLYWPFVFLIGIGITLPLYLLGRKHPKVAGIIASILFWCGIAFLALIFLVLIVGLVGLFIN